MALQVIATVLMLAGAVGLGVAVFLWARSWRQKLNEEPTIEAQIDSYRTMLNDGLLEQQEFERIVAQLEGRPVDPPTGIRPGLPPRPTDFRPGPPPDGDAPPSDFAS